MYIEIKNNSFCFSSERLDYTQLIRKKKNM